MVLHDSMGVLFDASDYGLGRRKGFQKILNKKKPSFCIFKNFRKNLLIKTEIIEILLSLLRSKTKRFGIRQLGSKRFAFRLIYFQPLPFSVCNL